MRFEMTPRATRHAATSTMPVSLSPMLAVSGPLPTGEGWAFEFKWDGVRALVVVESGVAHGRSRTGNDLTGSFPELQQLAASLAGRSVLLDGELVAMDQAGTPSFGRLQHRLGSLDASAARVAETPVHFLAFDVLHLDGTTMLDAPYDERRAVLESLGLKGERWAIGPSFVDVDGAAVLEAARAARLEGVVAKRRSSLYRPGKRDANWVKVKLEQFQEVVVVGWTQGNGARRSTFGALVLAVFDGGWVFVGNVGTGFTEREQVSLLEELRPHSRTTTPLVDASAVPSRDVHWVEPQLVGEVRFTEWTSDGMLRHPTWRGRRVDKTPREVRREG